ncbi:MAG: hypothetical protein OES38_01060 [Gammaproteobacteria bacterium]|nr:hypothetical protein [Gammaproteobacteria bacterium]
MKAPNSSTTILFGVSRLLLLLMTISVAVPGISVSNALAAPDLETDALAKEIDKSLRAAQRDMFNGKNESADQQLNRIATQIEQLKAADANHKRLKTLESKFAKIRKDVNRKLGRDTPSVSSSGPAAPPKPTTKAAPAVESAAVPASGGSQLPRAIQSDLANAKARLDETERKWAEDSSGGRTVSGSTDPRQVKMEAVEQPLNAANYFYGNILKKCERKSSPCEPTHPELVELKSRLDAMLVNVAGLQAEIDSAAAAEGAAAAAEMAKADAAEAACEAWKERMQVYTEGDKALYQCSGADDTSMPRCKGIYDEAAALMAEFQGTPWATEPCGALRSTMSDLNRYMDNFKETYASYADEQAAAKANMGDIVFSKKPIDPDKPSDLTAQFDAGDHIYGLIRTTKPWSVIYKNENSAEVMVNVKLDDKKIHAQFVKLKKPELLSRQYLTFEVAPDPDKMTAYGDPDREYGLSTAILRQGPNELTHHLAQLGPGQHTMEFDVIYYGTVWSAGRFTVAGDDFESYAKLHKEIAEGVAKAVTLPAANMTNKSMATQMKALLENAGWEDLYRINIVDKDWWIDRISGGDSAVTSRHLAAAALAKDGDGYYYKLCTFHQDKLLTGGFGELYLSHQGDRVPIPKANIDK